MDRRRLFFFMFVPTIVALFAGYACAQVKVVVTEPYESSQIAAAEQGVVQNILIREGQKIEADQVLANLGLGILPESRKLAELRAASQSRIKATKAELKLRQSQKENMDELIEKGHANPFEVQQVVAKFEQATAEYESALEQQAENLAELRRIDAEIDQRSIRSPIGGIVTEIQKRHGEFVSATDPVFATVVQLEKLRVRFYLHADTTSQLRAGQEIMVYVGRAQVETAGTIEFVSPVVEPKTGLARVNVLIDNRSLKIRSGVICSWDRLSASTAQSPGSDQQRRLK